MYQLLRDYNQDDRDLWNRKYDIYIGRNKFTFFIKPVSVILIFMQKRVFKLITIIPIVIRTTLGR